MNYFFRDCVDGVNAIDIHGQSKPVNKGDIVINSVGAFGKILGVSKDYGYHGMAMMFFPHGCDGKSETHSYPQSLQHTVILPGARIIKAKYDNPKLGIGKGDYMIVYKQRYFTKLPVHGYNAELLNQVRGFFNNIGD